MGVALASDAAAGRDEGLSRRGQIRKNLAGFKILHQRSGRYDNFKILRAAAGAVVARAVPAVFSDLMLTIFQIQQGVVRLGRPEDDVAALAAVAAVRTAFGDELLPPETHAARAAVSAPDEYLGFVNKFHLFLSSFEEGNGLAAQSVVATFSSKKKGA